MTVRTLIIATAHPRHDVLEQRVRDRLPAYRVLRIRSQDELTPERLDGIQPDYVVFPHWSWIIPAAIHTRFPCVIFHMTDLPYGRGGSPLQNLIVRGHTDTVLTALRCEAGLDTGDVYLKRPLSLAGTAEEILVRAASLMEDMIVEIVERKPHPVPQVGAAVTFTRRRPEDGNIALARSLEQVYNFIRMLDAEGYPKAFSRVGDLSLEFSDAHLGDGFVDARVRVRKLDRE